YQTAPRPEAPQSSTGPSTVPPVGRSSVPDRNEVETARAVPPIPVRGTCRSGEPPLRVRVASGRVRNAFVRLGSAKVLQLVFRLTRKQVDQAALDAPALQHAGWDPPGG